MTAFSVTHPDVSHVTAQEIEALAIRLEEDDYVNPFEALKDWHLLRAVAFQRQDLAEPYLYLLDIEAYDEA